MELMRECHESKYWFDLSDELKFWDAVVNRENMAVEFFWRRGCNLDLENKKMVLFYCCCRPDGILRDGQAETFVYKYIKAFMELVV